MRVQVAHAARQLGYPLGRQGPAYEATGGLSRSCRVVRMEYDDLMRCHRLRAFLPVAVALVLLALGLAAGVPAVPASACSAFAGSGPSGVFVGSNKDTNDPMFRLWFVPANEGKYGRFLFASSGIAGGGMNEHGLVVDQLTLPELESPGDGAKPIYSGSWPIHALETCRTVEEALAQFATYSFPGTWQAKIFLADASGDAAIIEGNAILRKSGRFLVTTNFIQSQTPPTEIDCERFLTATRMLEGAKAYDARLFTRIADAVHQEYPGGGGTVLSMVFNLTARRITCYVHYDFRHSVSYDLSSELAEHAHSVDIAEALPGNGLYSRWRAERLEELRRRVAALVEHGSVEADPTNIVGSYELDPLGDLVAVVPHYIRPFAVVASGGHVGVVASPEGDTIELFPAALDTYCNLPLAKGMPQISIRFARDSAGTITGGTLTLGNGAAAPFRRTSSGPCDQPLNHFWTEIPAPATPASTAIPTWLGAALVVAGILGLVLVLLLP